LIILQGAPENQYITKEILKGLSSRNKPSRCLDNAHHFGPLTWWSLGFGMTIKIRID
jgi:hypothetical protein